MLKNRSDPHTVIALSAFVKLMRAAETVSADIHRSLTQAQLTISQFGVLEALYHLGPMCQKDIANKILKSTGNLTMVLDNLEKRGLVQRKRDDQDRRYFVVHLTEIGEELIRRIWPRHEAQIRARMLVLEAGELKELGRLLKKLGIGKRDQDNPGGEHNDTGDQSR